MSSGRPLTVESHLGLVHAIARQRARGAEHCREDDLIQAGALGLMRALQLFNPERGCAFSTYAGLWIKQAIGRELQKHDRCVRLPVHVLAKRFAAGELRRERARSFDAPLAPSEGNESLHDILPSENTDPIARLDAESESAELAEAMARLTERERFVLRRRFWSEMTLEQIGAELGVTRERIRQIEARALEKLKKRLG